MYNSKKCKHRNCNRIFDLDFLAKNTKDPIFSNPKKYAKTKFKERIYCSKNCQIQELALQKTDNSMKKWKADNPLCAICKKNKPFKHIHDILINELNKIVANKEFYIIGGIINVNFVNETGQPKTNPDGTEIGHAMSWNWCEQDNIRKGHAHLLYGTKYSLNNEDLKITI